MGFFSRLVPRGGDPTEAAHPAAINGKTCQEAGDVLLEMSAFQGQLGQLFDEYRERTDSLRLHISWIF